MIIPSKICRVALFALSLEPLLIVGPPRREQGVALQQGPLAEGDFVLVRALFKNTRYYWCS